MFEKTPAGRLPASDLGVDGSNLPPSFEQNL
jgi:hypothetical protein